MKPKAAAVPALGAGVFACRVRLMDDDVVWVRSVLEAYPGLGSLYGDGAGLVTLLTTECQREDLLAWVDAISMEVAVELWL